MSRTKGGVKTRKRHKRVLKQTKGYYAARGKLYITAKETLDRALAYAFGGRKIKKRDYRSIWVARINAGLEKHDLSYSRFISALKALNVELDRRVLSDLAFHDTKAFATLATLAKGQEDKRRATLKKAA